MLASQQLQRCSASRWLAAARCVAAPPRTSEHIDPSTDTITMKPRCVWTIFLPIFLLPIMPTRSAPIVTMQTRYVGGFWSLDYLALDFYYSASTGAEFTNFGLEVTSSNGARILDPVRSQAGWYDQGGDAADTWANTPFSLLFGNAPSSVFQNYKPNAPGQSPIPTAHLDWEIFDSE